MFEPDRADVKVLMKLFQKFPGLGGAQGLGLGGAQGLNIMYPEIK